RPGGGHLRPRAARPDPAAHHQLRAPRSRVRPRLRAQHRPQGGRAARAVQLLRVRGHERRAPVQALGRGRSAMKIVVCFKQAPNTETRIRIADGKVVESDVNWIVSPYDEFALEEALKIKEKKGGEVVLLSLGPERVVSALRSGLAMGADSAVHLKDPKFDAADTLGIAHALA